MPCPSFEFSPEGRQGIGVNQPQSGLDYPLVNPVSNTPGDAYDVRYLLADFYLAYDDPGLYNPAVPIAQHPLRIKWLYGVGCEAASAPGWAPAPLHEADILVVDANNRVVFNSTQPVPAGGDPEFRRFVKRPWSADYDVYEWIGNNAVCRMVVYKTWPTAFDIAPRNWPIHLAPSNAVLDERAVHKMPRRLRSLSVRADGVLVGAPVRRAGAIFAASHNMTIAAAAPTGQPLQDTSIIFNCEPGTGTGKYNDCPDSTVSSRPIYSINGVAANAFGDFNISAGDCLFSRRPTTRAGSIATPVSQTLTLGTNCQPCCDCADYADTASYMNRIAAKYAEIGRQGHRIKLLYESNIDRWVEQRECRLQRPLRVALTPQNCPNIDVALMYCNHCQPCAENVTLNVTFSAFPAPTAVNLVCGYTRLTAPGYSGVEFQLTGTYPTFSAELPPVELGSSAYVVCRLSYAPKTVPYAVTATLTATQNGAPLAAGCEQGAPPAEIVATAALNCNSDGTTLQSC